MSELRMQPLQLPQSAMPIPSQSISPTDANAWKSWDHQLTYNIHTTNPHQRNPSFTTPYDDHHHHHMIGTDPAYNMNPMEATYYPPMPMQQLLSPAQYSDLQYQLQFQTIMMRQQQQQQLAQQLIQLSTVHPSQLPQLPVPQPSLSACKTTTSSPLSAETTETIITPPCIEKIFLNRKFVTEAVFKHLSAEIPSLSPHEVYEGFFVASNPTGYEWDMVLKVYYKTKSENKTYIKYYLVHQQFCLRGDRCSDALREASKVNECIQVELEVPLVLFNEFDHAISYVYGNDVYVGDSHLIALYVLIERLKLNGGIQEELLYEIRRCCDKFHCVSYLLKAEDLLSEELVWLCGDSILQNLSSISYYEWLSIPDTAFTRLIFQAVSGGIEKYSDYIVCELIMQYVKAIMSESHDQAKEIVRHLDSTDISSVSVDHCLPLLKICDVLFSDETQQWRYCNITVYELCLDKISAEFTPYHSDLCQQLQGLSPITFSQLLIRATHLPENALGLSLMAYKEGNHAAYYNDKHLRIRSMLAEREALKHKNDKENVLIATPVLNKEEDEMEANGSISQPVLVSPLEIENISSMNNRSRSPEKSLSKSPEYSVSGSYELSPCSVNMMNNHYDDEAFNNGSSDLIPFNENTNANNSHFVYESPLKQINTRPMRPMKHHFDDRNGELEDALLLKLIE
eukprot:209261_1